MNGGEQRGDAKNRCRYFSLNEFECRDYRETYFGQCSACAPFISMQRISENGKKGKNKNANRRGRTRPME